MKRFKILSFLLIIVLSLSMLSVPALAEGETSAGSLMPELTAQMAVLMDTDTGAVLYEKEGDTRADSYVLNQLMTLLLVCEAIDRQDYALNDMITVSATALSGLESAPVLASPALVPDESLTVENLVYMVAIPGFMDAANVLAEFNSGTVDAFVGDMNTRAQELGCTNTHFLNATGATVDGQYSTAHDVALITRELLKSPTIINVLQTRSYTIPATQYAGTRTITASNVLRDSGNSLYYEYTTIGKTGGVTSFGGNFAASASYNDLDVIAVVIGSSDGTTRFQDARNLFVWAYTNYGYRTLLNSTDILATVPVEMGSPSEIGVRAEGQVRQLMAVNEQLGELTYEISYQHEQTGKTLQAPISAGQYLGDVTVYMDGQNYGTARLVAATSSDISRLEYLGSQMNILLHTQAVQQTVKVLVIVLAVYLLLVAIYLIQRLRHLHSLRVARRDRAIAHSQQEIQWLDLPDEPASAPAPESLPPEEPAVPQEEYVEAEVPQEEYPEEAPLEGYAEEVPQEEHVEEAPQEEYAENASEEEYVEEAPQEEYPENASEEEYAEDVPQDEYVEEAPQEEYPENASEEEYPEEDYPEDEYPEDEYPGDEYPEGEYEDAPDGEYAEEEYGEEGDGEYADDQYDEEEYYEDEGPEEPPEPPKRRWWKRR